MTTPMQGPAIDPGTGKIYPEFIPDGLVGVGGDFSDAIAEAQLNTISYVAAYQRTFANLMPGEIMPVYCRGGVQPQRLTITARTDVYIAYVMPGVPVIGGLYGIEGDGHIPALAPDAMCDAQGLT